MSPTDELQLITDLYTLTLEDVNDILMSLLSEEVTKRSTITTDQLRIGDTIIERADNGTLKKTQVKSIGVGCNRFKVHVNGNQCWDRGYPITVE